MHMSGRASSATPAGVLKLCSMPELRQWQVQVQHRWTGHTQHHAAAWQLGPARVMVTDLESRLGLQVVLPGLQVILELLPEPCLLVTLAVLLVLLELLVVPQELALEGRLEYLLAAPHQ